jgi:hypothetical protein
MVSFTMDVECILKVYWYSLTVCSKLLCISMNSHLKFTSGSLLVLKGSGNYICAEGLFSNPHKRLIKSLNYFIESDKDTECVNL